MGLSSFLRISDRAHVRDSEPRALQLCANAAEAEPKQAECDDKSPQVPNVLTLPVLLTKEPRFLGPRLGVAEPAGGILKIGWPRRQKVSQWFQALG